MEKILECVPNFSEGKDEKVILSIVESIKRIKNVKLLDIDPGFHANRTVYTFVGEPEQVIEAAFEAMKTAQSLIDMSIHRGEHPRIGAMDVCPIIPIKGITMIEAIRLSEILGKRIADELHIPVYLYEHSARKEERKNLAWVRSGEYEQLKNKMERNDFLPDFGKPVFNPKSGIAIVGAREFLIAYNINLDTLDIQKAKQIAEIVRESGKNGIKGKLNHLKAIAWYIKEFDKIQISMNLTNYKQTPLWQVFETVKQTALEFEINITGSELVGMIPLDAMLETAEYFIRKNELKKSFTEIEKVEFAVNQLGLREVKEFDLNKKIIEFALKNA